MVPSFDLEEFFLSRNGLWWEVGMEVLGGRLESVSPIVCTACLGTNRIRLRSREGQRGLKISKQRFCTHELGAGGGGAWGGTMRSEQDSTVVMKGLLAFYQLWPQREYSCKRLHRVSA